MKPTFTPDQAHRIAENAIGLFLESRDQRGRDATARIEAIGEVAETIAGWLDVEVDTVAAGPATDEVEGRDGGRSPTPDQTYDAIASAERAVHELKGRRALEEQ